MEGQYGGGGQSGNGSTGSDGETDRGWTLQMVTSRDWPGSGATSSA